MTRYTGITAIVEDPEHPGEMLLDLGQELCEHLGWQPGDALEWIDNGDRTWTIKKARSKHSERD